MVDSVSMQFSNQMRFSKHFSDSERTESAYKEEIMIITDENGVSPMKQEIPPLQTDQSKVSS